MSNNEYLNYILSLDDQYSNDLRPDTITLYMVIFLSCLLLTILNKSGFKVGVSRIVYWTLVASVISLFFSVCVAYLILNIGIFIWVFVFMYDAVQ